MEGIAHPAQAETPSTLALAVEPAAFRALSGSPAKAAIVASEADLSGHALSGVIRYDRSRWALSVVTRMLSAPPHHEGGVHPTAIISPSASVAEDVAIGAYAVIGPGVEIGPGSVLYPRVTIGAGATIGAGCRFHCGVYVADGVRIGERVEIHAYSVIGSDGFGYATPEVGSVEVAKASGRVEAQNADMQKIMSLGSIEIGDDVEIGAGTTIDKATFSATRIGKRTKIDNQVQIGHNVEIGEDCLIVAQVGLAGSARIGDRVVLAGKVGVADHVRVGSDSIVAAGSGVAGNVPERELYAGYPAQQKDKKFAELKALYRLPKLIDEVERLRREVDAMRAGDGTDEVRGPQRDDRP